jgi:S-formylglutathione hydrolase
MKCIEKRASFGGWQEVWEHEATTLGCTMKFAVYLPPQCSVRKCPVLYWLSGLTCTEQNFITKAGAQYYASLHGIVLVVPDTSPRGEVVPDDAAYDLGQGAGFYLNATQDPWRKHYQMFDYVTEELPAVVERHFPVTALRSIAGHSMGGHGALVAVLKKPGFYRSVSAFAPIAAPSSVPWGRKAFAAYLGEDQQTWQAWDSCALLRQAATRISVRVEQGGADEFMQSQLKPDMLREVCALGGHELDLRIHDGYDHSYYFIASFMGEHVAYHADALAAC